MEIFFYGLFMDELLLAEKGIIASNPRKAVLKDYSLIVGERASLIPSNVNTVYGIVMTLDPEQAERLYSEPSVADYVPEKVTVSLSNGESIEALCYNLPKHLITGANVGYAKKLLVLAKSMQFPERYLKQIGVFT